jgi:hypothetical protein
MSKKFFMNLLRDYLLGLVGVCFSIKRILDAHEKDHDSHESDVRRDLIH